MNHEEAAGSRADRSEAYRDARAEYARIRALREVSPIAAHLRVNGGSSWLTQEEVTKAAETSHSAVSRLEKGKHIPQLPTLQRIAAVLDEELLVCFQRTVDGEVKREFAAVAGASDGTGRCQCAKLDADQSLKPRWRLWFGCCLSPLGRRQRQSCSSTLAF